MNAQCSYLKHRNKTITIVIIISDTNTPPTNAPAIGRISERRKFCYTDKTLKTFHSNDHKYFNLPILSSSDVVVDVLLTEMVCVEIDVEWMIKLVDD